MHRLPLRSLIMIAALALPAAHAYAQAADATQTANVAAAGQPAQAVQRDVEDAVRRFGIGVDAGVGLDPELVMFGGHGTFSRVFSRAVSFRPGLEFGIGEVTTLMNINLDVLYSLPGTTRSSRWMAYVGGGPAFGMSHRGFSSAETDHVTVDGTTTGTTTTVTSTTTTSGTVSPIGQNRFNFSDTDFNGGFNFIAGARKRSGLFFELKATAWGVSNIRLMAGFNF